jgi:aryl-alcohol dehydrogenase
MGQFGFVAFNEGAGAVVEASKFFLGQALQGIVQGSAVPQVFIPELISLHRAGHFPFERLVTIGELERAFADTANGSSQSPPLRWR